MTTFEPTAPTPQVAPAALRLAPALYATTLFLSALLLFLVQPMFTKLVLPRLGGAPTVWSVAMVFFQAALLAGYAYAHLLIRRLPLGIGALLHLGVGRDCIDLADRHRGGPGTAAPEQHRALADRAVRRFDRPAVRGSCG